MSTRPRSSLSGQRKLAIEAVVIFGLIVLTAFLIFHFVVHTIRNPRPLGGANVDVSAETWTQSEASFAIDPARARFLFGATNDTGGETGRIAVSRDGGATWRRSDGPVVPVVLEKYVTPPWLIAWGNPENTLRQPGSSQGVGPSSQSPLAVW